MPRKDSKTPEALARSRDDQRRARARRQSLVQDLQGRLAKYEQNGAEATMDMQQAAQSVARENARLRQLLALKGVQPHEIDTFLRSDGGGIPSATTTGGGGGANHQRHHSYSSSIASNGFRSMQMSRDMGEYNGHDALARLADSASTTPRFDMSPAGLETPCGVAANMIAETTGHEDVARVLMSLGCADQQHCLVKNVKIFELLN